MNKYIDCLFDTATQAFRRGPSWWLGLLVTLSVVSAIGCDKELTAEESSAVGNPEALATVGQLCPGPFKNSGQCLSCAAHVLNELKKTGQITGAQHGQIMSELANNGCPSSSCTSDPVDVTCAGKCGLLTDNCGSPVDCGTSQCVAPAICGAVSPNVCGCIPTTCQAQGQTCGRILDDGCGGTLDCGPCDLGACSALYDGVDHPVFTPGANCQNLVGPPNEPGIVMDGVIATNRNDCYSRISFGSCNCAIYGVKGYFPVSGVVYFLDQRFATSDRISSEPCTSQGMNVPALQGIH